MKPTPPTIIRTPAAERADNLQIVAISGAALLLVISLRQLLMFSLDSTAQPIHYLSEWLIDLIGLILLLGIVWAANLPAVFGGRRIARIATILALDAVVRTVVPYLVRSEFPRWFFPEFLLVIFVGVGVIAAVSVVVDRQRQQTNSAAELLTEVGVVSTAMVSLKDQQERTRRHISEGLHGSIQQSLVIVEERLRGAARQANEHGQSDLAAELVEIRNVLTSVREVDVRSLGQLIRPVGIDVGASAALRVLMNRVPPSIQTDSELTERFVLEDENLSMDSRMLVFSIAQEALTNALKHGPATAVRLSADVGGAPAPAIRVTFEDNGVTSSATLLKGEGLTRLERRLAQVGGDLRIARSPILGGVMLVAHVPLSRDAAARV